MRGAIDQWSMLPAATEIVFPREISPPSVTMRGTSSVRKGTDVSAMNYVLSSSDILRSCPWRKQRSPTVQRAG
jgi:hypothetical protein